MLRSARKKSKNVTGLCGVDAGRFAWRLEGCRGVNPRCSHRAPGNNCFS
jgi:hypothetical protein